MTAPAVNGTRYPQPVDELLPAARQLADELGKVPSRNELMTRFRIGAPKAKELRDRLTQDLVADPWQVLREVVAHAEQTGTVLTGEQIVAAHRLEPDVADLVSSLASVGVDRRSKGLPTDLDDDWQPPLRRTDDERQADIDVPLTDPWDYAEPIGPDPAPAGPGSGPAVNPDQTAGSVDSQPTAADRQEMPPAPVENTPDTRVRVDTVDAPKVTDLAPAVEEVEQPTTVGHPGTPTLDGPRKPLPVWPVWLLMLPAFVAVWAGWVELGKLTGFGPVDLLPGFTRDGQPLLTLDTAITLPIGMETYAGYALYIWLSGRTTRRARNFAMASALIALTLGGGAQITYHLLTTPDTGTPWQITTIVACLPVAVLGMGAALAHLVREDVTR